MVVKKGDKVKEVKYTSQGKHIKKSMPIRKTFKK